MIQALTKLVTFDEFIGLKLKVNGLKLKANVRKPKVNVRKLKVNVRLNSNLC